MNKIKFAYNLAIQKYYNSLVHFVNYIYMYFKYMYIYTHLT